MLKTTGTKIIDREIERRAVLENRMGEWIGMRISTVGHEISKFADVGDEKKIPYAIKILFCCPQAC